MDKLIFSLKKQARLAGLFYLLHIATAIYGIIFVSSKIGVSGTPEMANQILANEFLFRTGIFNRLLCSIPWLFLAVTLYRLLKNVNYLQAKLMFAWLTLPLCLQFIAEAFNITTLSIARGELIQTYDLVHRQTISVLLLHIYNNIVSLSEIFWGLWLLPFGLLIYRSHFIPKTFGVLVIIGGACYLIDFSAFILFPIYKNATTYLIFLGSLCEISMMLWLIIKGVKKQFNT